jgi:RNA polymerase sigma-70 factor (ECF subfamily)
VPDADNREAVGNTRDTSGAWEDRRVLEGVRRRDPDALGRFFDVAFPYVYSVAFRLMGNHHIAEDVAQDVFLKVYRAADRLDVDRHPKPWITTITYNACRDAARRSTARPEEAVDATSIGERHQTQETPEDIVIREERDRLVEQALRELDAEWRAVVILHDYCGYSHEEIADIVGASHAAVRKRYSRALKRMAEILRGLQK